MTDMRAEFPVGDNLPDPLFIFNDDTRRLVWMNNAAEVWLRRPLSILAGSNVSELGKGFENLSQYVDVKDGSFSTYRGYDLTVNVRRRDYKCRFQLFKCPAGIALHMNPKETGATLPQTGAADQSVVMLGKMLAHELKNPLAGIRGAAQLLENDLDTDDGRELTALIASEVDRLGRLAERMESFGQVSVDNFSLLNIHEVIRKAALIFENQVETDIQFTETFDPSLPDVYGDADGLMQVIVNLLANAVDAIQHSDIGDAIEIKTRYRTGFRKKSSEGERHSLPVEVQIIDNGPGISPKLRERIFQPFVTSKANGQGLGLALISKIIADHSGLIEASSEPGDTVFSLLLPTQPLDKSGS